jgi:hypothetical protein
MGQTVFLNPIPGKQLQPDEGKRTFDPYRYHILEAAPKFPRSNNRSERKIQWRSAAQGR